MCKTKEEYIKKMSEFAEEICMVTENFNMGFIDGAELLAQTSEIFVKANLPYNMEEMKEYRGKISEIALEYRDRIFCFDHRIA